MPQEKPNLSVWRVLRDHDGLSLSADSADLAWSAGSRIDLRSATSMAIQRVNARNGMLKPHAAFDIPGKS
jgi:hypothetical protein